MGIRRTGHSVNRKHIPQSQDKLLPIFTFLTFFRNRSLGHSFLRFIIRLAETIQSESLMWILPACGAGWRVAVGSAVSGWSPISVMAGPQRSTRQSVRPHYTHPTRTARLLTTDGERGGGGGGGGGGGSAPGGAAIAASAARYRHRHRHQRWTGTIERQGERRKAWAWREGGERGRWKEADRLAGCDRSAALQQGTGRWATTSSFCPGRPGGRGVANHELGSGLTGRNTNGESQNVTQTSPKR